MRLKRVQRSDSSDWHGRFIMTGQCILIKMTSQCLKERWRIDCYLHGLWVWGGGHYWLASRGDINTQRHFSQQEILDDNTRCVSLTHDVTFLNWDHLQFLQLLKHPVNSVLQNSLGPEVTLDCPDTTEKTTSLCIVDCCLFGGGGAPKPTKSQQITGLVLGLMKVLFVNIHTW